MLCKKAVYNGLGLDVYIPFDFQLRIYSMPLSFLTLRYLVLIDKQMHFENHHHQKKKKKNQKNETFAV